MSKIGVVILNFLNYKDTINCVNCFLSQVRISDSIQIVIVDNDSPNESFDELTNAFKGNQIIHVIQTTKNLGFACGNNFGYRFLVDSGFSLDFVICSNDDILLPDSGLFDWIEREYEAKAFAILGPDIRTQKEKRHQSPLEKPILDITLHQKKIQEIERKYKTYSLIPSFMFSWFSKNKSQYHNPKWEKEQKDVVLQGSFLVFSKKYFAFYAEMFDPDTFLYYEENILFLRCFDKKIELIYSPNYYVIHLQSISTNLQKTGVKKKKLIRMKYEIESMKRYQSILERNRL